MMRPIFCGNFEFDARPSDLERLFRRYGEVDRVDMKTGFAFIYMEDERDAEYAVRALNQTEFGRKGRRLRVEWTKHERGGDRKHVSTKRSANLRPSKTLFVINFPYHTKERDLERHFDLYGKIHNVRIRKNFAFVQYESQEDATKALEATNMSKFLDRVISVEYSARDDNGGSRNSYSPDRKGRDRSPDRRRRSPSPYKRQRGSPDYGAGSSPTANRRERGSPVYGNGASCSPRRADRGANPVYNRAGSLGPRQGEVASLGYRGRGHSPIRSRSRSPRAAGRERSPRGVGRESSPHAVGRERCPRGIGRERSPRGIGRERSPREVGRERSPRGVGRERSPRGVGREISPRREREISPPRVGNGNGYGHRRSPSPEEREEGAILDDDQDYRSPVKRSISLDMPVGDGAPDDDRYGSRSLLARERSES